MDNDEFLSNEQYAFNYWILTHLFNIDIECVSDCIVERNGNGIDCFVHYEDTKELYIIQNKKYATSVKRNDAGDFLNIISTQLLYSKYYKSKELQDAFNDAIKDREYKIYIQLLYNKQRGIY